MNSSLFANIAQLHRAGFRQLTECDCGPAAVVLCARAMGLKRITYETLLTEDYGRWLNRQAGRVRGMMLTELHFAAEATFGTDYEVRMKRAFAENRQEFELDLGAAAGDVHTIVINFNQDYLLKRPYKNDETAFTHYSPIMGYQNGQVTVADVDRGLDEPYTESAEEVFNSMAEPHNIFGYPRGWLTIRKRIAK